MEAAWCKWCNQLNSKSCIGSGKVPMLNRDPTKPQRDKGCMLASARMNEYEGKRHTATDFAKL